jgi:thymidylate synthase
MFNGKTFLIEGKNNVDAWGRAIKLISQQPDIISGEDYTGNAKNTKDCNLIIVLDDEAVEDIVEGKVHPAFEQGKQAMDKYNEEFTYKFVKDNWEAEEKLQFVYNYFDRFINYPLPVVFIYQGKLLELPIPEKYYCKDREGGFTGGLDQILWLHDAIRKDGISRRHEIITWIPAIDDFNDNPPCLQRIWIRVLVPKEEWSKYNGNIPVEVHVEYRSWDVGRAMPSNLYGLINMLYRYIFGNLTEENEYKNGVLNPYNHIEFKIVKLVLFGNSCHVYEDNRSIFELKSKKIVDRQLRLFNNC